jgi:hypothetical protein
MSGSFNWWIEGCFPQIFREPIFVCPPGIKPGDGKTTGKPLGTDNGI